MLAHRSITTILRVDLTCHLWVHSVNRRAASLVTPRHLGTGSFCSILHHVPSDEFFVSRGCSVSKALVRSRTAHVTRRWRQRGTETASFCGARPASRWMCAAAASSRSEVRSRKRSPSISRLITVPARSSSPSGVRCPTQRGRGRLRCAGWEDTYHARLEVSCGPPAGGCSGRRAHVSPGEHAQNPPLISGRSSCPHCDSGLDAVRFLPLSLCRDKEPK